MNDVAPCPIDGFDSPRFLRASDINRGLGGGPFAYHRCPNCRTVFMHEVPNDLSVYYPDDYYLPQASISALASVAERERYKVDILRRFKRSGRLLEIGPAHGAFSYLARRAGFDVSAIEMSAECCRILRELANVNAIQSDDPAAVLPTLGHFDVIAMWHVIEHLRDPMRIVRLAADSLADGGVLIVASPNPEAWQFRMLGARWPHLDAPRHLSLIPLATLRREAEKNGLRFTWSTFDDAGTRALTRWGWQAAVANLARPRAAKVVLALAGRVLAEAVRPWDDRDGHSSAFTLVMKKSISVAPPIRSIQ